MMENILLDFKTASESFFVAPASHEEEEHVHELHVSPQQPMDTPYEVLDTIPTEQNEVPLAAQPTVEPTVAPSTPSVSMNYEAMNIKELQQEARTRNISGVSGMRRKELIQNLRNTDDTNAQKAPTNDISGAHSPLTEGVEQLDIVQHL